MSCQPSAIGRASLSARSRMIGDRVPMAGD